MVEISASVLNVNKENATRTFYDLETAKINYFHIDVMDGKFVKNNTEEIMKDYALTISHISNLGLDVHFMVEDVEKFIDEYSMLEPEIISFHIEATKNEERTKNAISLIKSIGSKVGIAINPDTSIEQIKQYLPFVHMILVMTVVPGEGGQKIIPEAVDKVKELKQYIEVNNIDINIEVDGGINSETAKECIEAGADILVAGKYLVSSKDFNQAVKSLR